MGGGQVCKEGDDGQYGSAAVCDVLSLQALSKRIHYGPSKPNLAPYRYPDRFLEFLLVIAKGVVMIPPLLNRRARPCRHVCRGEQVHLAA
jgi:hypothetical protein